MKGENRGFLQDIEKFVDLLQEIIVKADLILTKLDEALDLMKQGKGDE